MKLPYLRLALPLLALSAAVGLGACSRAQHTTDSLTGPGRSGAGTQVVAGCPTLVANTLNTAFNFNTEFGAVVQFRTNRLRIETVGDAAEVSIAAMGPCAAADIPTINFISGHANVFVAGSNNSITTTGNRLTFGAILSPGSNVEPGVVLASDAEGNVLEIIWPELAGLGAGSPIVRVQLAAWNTGRLGNHDVDVTWDFTATADGVQTSFKGHCEGMALDGTPVSPGGAAIPACPTTLAGTGGAVVIGDASIVQFRPGKRLRLEALGDVASGAINQAGGCAAADVPTIRFTGGSANMFRAGSNNSVTSTGRALTFGPLLFPGLALEPGVVVANDAAGNVLEIIWPGLAGLPPGSPILRLQLAQWNSWILTGRRVDATMRFDAAGPAGSTATYTVNARNVLVPQAR